ncbi:MAG: glycosyltransferase [Roseitalea sp.]|jgi:glycosyltransferase involved in cell wall biosynthesis|nr:glycosyltransferase [Roseitalea sp.]MBO6741261.1 glycosyltransferase [Roseitalea sp.]
MSDTSGLRIVHVLRAPMGGVLRHVRDLALAQVDAGHQVGLVCDVPGPDGYNETMLGALGDGLPLGLHRVAMARAVGFGDIASARAILAVLKRLKPDIVHGHGAKGGVHARAIGALANRQARPARLYSPHGGSLHFDPQSRTGKLYFAVERMLERACETILFVADYERSVYETKIGVPRCATHVVHNGLTPPEFEPVKPVAGAAAFLFIGEIRMLKGPDLFVDAIAALRASGHADTNAVMVGAGPDRTAIAERIGAHGLASAVTMHDPMPARDAFALAQTVVMPSRAEAMPYIVLEALAAGKPLIATHVGGIPEIVGSDNPALVEPTLEALTGVMRRSLDQPGWLESHMVPATTLKSRFSAAVMAESITNAYREALTRARSGAPVHPSRDTRANGASSVS